MVVYTYSIYRWGGDEMTDKGAKTRPVRTEGPISDMAYEKIGTVPPGTPMPVINPPWLKKSLPETQTANPKPSFAPKPQK